MDEIAKATRTPVFARLLIHVPVKSRDERAIR